MTISNEIISELRLAKRHVQMSGQVIGLADRLKGDCALILKADPAKGKIFIGDNMKTGFPNELEGPKTEKVRNPWDFSAPPYDERSSCFINAGTNQGIGKRNPVGHDGPVKQRVPTLPYGKVNTLEFDFTA